MRLEASVYATDAQNAKKLISQCKYGTMCFSKFIKSCFYPGRFKRAYLSKKPSLQGFLGSAEMLALNPEPVKWMQPIPEVSVKEGQLLLSRSGTIGNVIFVNMSTNSLICGSTMS